MGEENQQKLTNLKGTLDVVQEIDNTAKELREKSRALGDDSKKTSKIVKDVIDPVQSLLDNVKKLMSTIQKGDIKEDAGNVENLNTGLLSLTSGLNSLNTVIKNINDDNYSNVNIGSYIDGINVLIEQIKNFNLKEVPTEQIEGIKNRVTSIGDVFEGVKSVGKEDPSKNIDNIMKGLESIGKILNYISTVTESNQQEGSLKDTFINLTKKQNNPTEILSRIFNFLKDIKELAGKDKTDSKFVNQLKQELNQISSLVGGVTQLLEKINNKKINIDNDYVKNFLEVTKFLKEMIENIKEMNKSITIKSIISQMRKFPLMSLFLTIFINEVNTIGEKIKDVNNIDTKIALNDTQSIKTLIESIFGLKINPRMVLSMTSTFWQLKLLLLIYGKNIESIKKFADGAIPIDVSVLIKNNESLLSVLKIIENINKTNVSSKTFEKKIDDFLDVLSKLDKLVSKINSGNKNSNIDEANKSLTKLKEVVLGIDAVVGVFVISIPLYFLFNKSIRQLRRIVMGLDLVLLTFIASIPLYALFVLVSPAIILCIWTVSKILKVIMGLLSGVNTMAKEFVKINIIFGLILVLIFELDKIAELSATLLSNIGNVFLILTAIIGIIGVIALMGAGLSLVMPFIVTATIGLAAVSLSIFAILSIVAILYLIQNISLDKERIEHNVQEVMDVVMMILKTLTTSPADFKSERNEENKSLWSLLGNSMVNMLSSIIGMGTIAAAAISVGGILLIVSMLKLIEYFKLDETKIRNNVSKILTIVNDINSILISDPSKGKKSQYGFWDTVIEYVAKPIVPLWDAILTMAYLAMAVISVTGILIIAGMLKIIQGINLDRGKISKNIQTIMDTVKEINDSLNAPIASTTQFNRGILGGILSYISPQIGALWSSIITMAYLAMAVISVSSILLISGMLRLIQGLNLDKNKITENIRSIIECIKEISDSLNEPITETSQFNRGILGGLLSYISPQIGSLWNSIITIAYLAVTIINIAGLLLIAQMLKKVADVDDDIIEQSRNNARNIIAAAHEVMDIIYNSENTLADEETKQPKWYQKALNWIGLGDFVEAIINLGKLSQLVIVVGSLSKLTKQLNSIELKEGGIDRVVNSSIAVINAAEKITKNIVSRDTKDLDKNKFKEWNKNIDQQKDLIKHIKALAKAESSLVNDITIEDIMNSSNLSKLSIESMDDFIKNMNNINVDPDSIKEKLSLIDSMNNSIRNIATVSDQDVKNTKDLTDTYIRFINRLDQSDLQRLNVTERMMGHWAYIAKMIDGDFDKLVLMLSEKMMPMLDSMNKTMEGVSEVQQSIIMQLADPTLGNNQGSYPDVENENGNTGNTGGESQFSRPTGEDLTAGNPTIQNEQQLTNEKPPTVVPESSIGTNNPSSERGFITKGLSGARRGTEDEPVYAIIVGTK